jgi:hypothetical protein
MFLMNFWTHSPNAMTEKYCENLKSHTIFATEQKYCIDRQFYVEEFVFQTWELSEIWEVQTDAVMKHPILSAYGDKYKVIRAGHFPQYLSHLTLQNKCIPCYARKVLLTHLNIYLSLEKLI